MSRQLLEEELRWHLQESIASKKKDKEHKALHKTLDNIARRVYSTIMFCSWMLISLEVLGEAKILPWIIVNCLDLILLGGICYSIHLLIKGIKLLRSSKRALF